MIRSPYQNPIIEKLKSDVAIVKLASDLVAVHEKFIAKLDETTNLINKKVGPKGDKGDNPSYQEVLSAVRELMPTISEQYLINLITPLIPKIEEKEIISKDEIVMIAKSCIPATKDVVITDEHINKISERVSSRMKPAKQEKNELDIENLLSLIEKRPKGKRISLNFIDGLEQTIQSLSSQITSKGYLHGGGDTIVSGAGITITTNANGNKIISASSSLGGYQIPTSGSVGQDTFTWTIAPNIIVSDGISMVKTRSDGTPNWTGTTTTVLTVAPSFDIFSTN